MGYFLYTVIIFPIIQLIELSYVLTVKVIKDPALALVGVSLAVSIFTLPLYFIAEKHQQIERDLQKRFKPKIDKIKSVFKGDTRYMVLSTFYKQNHYHPIYAMRSTFGLLIQIPFFIAAYSYLSKLEALQGLSLFFISDLSKPDALFSFGGLFSINILPVLMTVINILSGVLYTKGLEIKEKVQVFGISLIFLVLLYNSPSGLVLYWTMNNIFSFTKNALQKTKNTKRIIFISLCIIVLILDLYLIFLHPGYWLKRAVMGIIFSCIFLLPFFVKLLEVVKQKFFIPLVQNNASFWRDRVFILSSAVLFLLAGLVIPSSLIVSSVSEFSFIEPHSSPLPFIFNTAIQAAGVFLFWPICVYYLFSRKVKIGLTIIMSALSFICLYNVFMVSENFGFLTNTLIFSEPKSFYEHYKAVFVNIAGITAVLCLFIFILFSKRKNILVSLSIIAVISLSCYGVFNTGLVYKKYTELEEHKRLESYNSNFITPIYTVSKTGKNVLYFLLDRAMSGYVPFIFEEKPELISQFSGFTWFPNCASFAGHTIVGAPSAYGSYDYTPRAINERNTVTMSDKHEEAYLLLPLLFSNNGFSVTVSDPPNETLTHSTLSTIFNDYPQINMEFVRRKYTSLWLQRHPDVSSVMISDVLNKNLLRFSFFKTSPLLVRQFIYDRSIWLTASNIKGKSETAGQLTIDTINEYVFLDILPELTGIDENNTNNLTMIYNLLPSYSGYFQAPDYIPQKEITNMGNSRFAYEVPFHPHVATFLLLGKYFSYLKENDAYDNTKIILVADHGAGNTLMNHPGNFTLPNGDDLSKYNPLLMIKDFNSKGDLVTDNSFMTNADAPLLALADIVNNPVNPVTNIPLRANKSQGIYIATINNRTRHGHTKYQYKIDKNQWLFVKDNIFDINNWRKDE